MWMMIRLTNGKGSLINPKAKGKGKRRSVVYLEHIMLLGISLRVLPQYSLISGSLAQQPNGLHIPQNTTI